MGRQWEERERRNNSQPEQNRISKRMVFRRTVILMLICGVGFFIPLAVQLWNISIRDHNFYQQKAAEQQLMDVAVAAHRGDILDANGEVMAMSATVYNLILAPKDLINSVERTTLRTRMESWTRVLIRRRSRGNGTRWQTACAPSVRTWTGRTWSGVWRRRTPSMRCC